MRVEYFKRNPRDNAKRLESALFHLDRWKGELNRQLGGAVMSNRLKTYTDSTGGP